MRPLARITSRQNLRMFDHVTIRVRQVDAARDFLARGAEQQQRHRRASETGRGDHESEDPHGDDHASTIGTAGLGLNRRLPD
jgi:hypothetical protein